jgi:hypothetical protein
MGEGDVRSYLAGYQRAGRSIWIQELDLPAAARVEIRDFLDWNSREENKYYQYHYYLDNCSTRIRDAIDRAVGGQLRRWAEARPTAMTYRDHTRRLTENSPLFRTVLDIGLGQPVDHRLSAWEEMFLPISLRPFLDSVTVADPNGRSHPLVRTSRHVVESDRFPVPSGPADWRLRYLLLGTLLGGVLAVLGRWGRRSSGGRLAFGIGATTWTFFTGLVGLALAALWALTRHDFSYRNENLLQLNLLALALSFVLPRAVARGGAGHRAAMVLAGGTALVSAAGLLLKVLPAFDQANQTVIALALPVHLGVLAGLRALRPRPIGSGAAELP